jgi:hypothetical protein
MIHVTFHGGLKIMVQNIIDMRKRLYGKYSFSEIDVEERRRRGLLLYFSLPVLITFLSCLSSG